MLSMKRAQALAAHPAGQPLADTMINAVGVSGSDIYAGTDIGMSVSSDSGHLTKLFAMEKALT